MNKKIKLFSNCIPVKGFTNSIICDVQRRNFEFIPNDLFDLLKKYDGKLSADEIKKVYDNEFDNIIDEYINFLLEKEFIFFTDTPQYFPKINMQFHYPFEISNAIVEFYDDRKYDLYNVIQQLDDLNCKHVEFRLIGENDINKVYEICQFISSSNLILTSCSFFVSFSEKCNNRDFLTSLLTEFPRITSIVIYNSSSDLIITTSNKRLGKIEICTKDLSHKSCCGNIKPSNFVVNISNFTESLNFNSCLNMKISVNSNGDIMNCPSMPDSYGNINTISLQQALSNKEFKKYWMVNKDKIDVCKDCEFRYICTDCRAYTEDIHIKSKNLNLSKPLKCGYDPYTGNWEDWSSNPIKLKFMANYK